MHFAYWLFLYKCLNIFTYVYIYIFEPSAYLTLIGDLTVYGVGCHYSTQYINKQLCIDPHSLHIIVGLFIVRAAETVFPDRVSGAEHLRKEKQRHSAVAVKIEQHFFILNL